LPSVGTAMGLINYIPTVGELVTRIVDEAEELIIGRLGDMVEPAEEERVSPEGIGSISSQ
jgi:NADH:quinone reductase (non-electrogenic)